MADKQIAIPNQLPILPVRDTVLFPGAVLPLTVGRDSSLALINSLAGEDKVLGVVAQHDPRVEDPAAADLHKVGTFAKVHKTVKMPNGNVVIFLEGLQRFRSSTAGAEAVSASASGADAGHSRRARQNSKRCIATRRRLFRDVVSHSPQLSDDLQSVSANIDDRAG
jgi:ATP-dependent Lon protease